MHDEELLPLCGPKETPGAKESGGIGDGVCIWNRGDEGVYVGDDVGEAGGFQLVVESVTLAGDMKEGKNA